MKKSIKIYLDYASATPIDSRVISFMNKILKENYANPSAIHELGVKVKKILEQARKNVAEILGAHSDEIIFTSGATESNNLAILGILAHPRPFPKAHPQPFPKAHPQPFPKGREIPHIITTNIEHSSVLEVCKHLEKTKQAEVTYVKVEANGIVDSKKIRKAIKLNTVLISVMYANNEIGTIQPIMEIAKEIRHFKKNQHSAHPQPFPKGREKEKVVFWGRFPLFHTDATQAINYLPIKVEKLGIDLMSFNGGKIYGPKGIGCLYVKRKTPINKIIFGGDQEFGLRAGTENVVNIVGLAEALKITEEMKEKENKRLTNLRDYFIKELLKLDSKIKVNGDLEKRLPNNVNITIPKIPSDLLVLEFSARGIYVSERSACKSSPSPALPKGKGESPTPTLPEGKGEERNSLRFSLGRQTKKADIDYVIKALSEILNKLKKWYN